MGRSHNSVPTNEQLIDRCRQGSDLAWEALVRRFEGRVYGIAMHYLRDREEARDAAQDVFVKIYGNLHTLKEDKPFLPWMLRIARNACIDRIRRLKVRTPDVAVPLEESPEIQIPTDGPTPEEALMQGAREGLVHRALDALSAGNREMILLKDIQGLKLEEIAEMLDLPLGTAKSRSHRARIELGKAIQSLEPSFGA